MTRRPVPINGEGVPMSLSPEVPVYSVIPCRFPCGITAVRVTPALTAEELELARLLIRRAGADLLPLPLYRLLKARFPDHWVAVKTESKDEGNAAEPRHSRPRFNGSRHHVT